jgi:hypothetical protein
MRSLVLAPALALTLAAASVQALEPLRAYDRFTDKTIDPARWTDNERIREIRAGQLRHMQRSWSSGLSDAGVTNINWNSNLPNPQAVTALRARITVTAVEANACASNASAGDSRARIIGSFFNTGAPVPGSQVNDVIAQVRVLRPTNSTDPAGVLQVRGLLSVCTSADCNLATTIGNVVDLGTTTVGTPTTVQIQWDQPGKTFYFARDGGPGGTVAYSESDATAPTLAFKQLSTRVIAPNCMSAPRVSGFVDALFDNVFVNQSAAP